MQEIVLPRTTKEGKPRISYSQVNLFKELKSFNMDREGWMEYVCLYFLGVCFEDSGYGEFGHDCEDYIAERLHAHKFTDKEKSVLETIKPLGKFQTRLEVDFGDFVLLLIIDDANEDFSMIRDYKTGSETSLGKYRKDDYFQMDYYALGVQKNFGKIPEMEVCAIERKGNPKFGKGEKGRGALTVGDKVWYIPRETDEQRLAGVEHDIREAVKEISKWYKIFKKINAV